LAKDYTAIFIYFFFISLHAMEKQPIKAKIVAELTPFPKPTSIICLPQNKAIILGKHSCGLYDLFTTEKIATFNTYEDYSTNCQRIMLNRNKTKLAIVRKIFPKEERTTVNIEIYDVTTYEKVKEHKNLIYNLQTNATFDSATENTLLLYDGKTIQAFDHTNDSLKNYTLGSIESSDRYSNYTNAGCVFHPHKPQMIFFGCGIAYIFEFNKELQQFINPKKITIGTEILSDYIYSCQYSPDGSWIITNSQFRGCSIFDSQNNLVFPLTKNAIEGIACDPTSSIVATVNGKDLWYWNINTKKLLLSTELEENIFGSLVSTIIYQPISFSDDGTKLIVGHQSKCSVVEVPFEIHNKKPCELGTKDKCYSVCWILQNYPEISMPQEIKQLIIYHLLDASEYQSKA
jgi:WD40 repeat protein